MPRQHNNQLIDRLANTKYISQKSNHAVNCINNACVRRKLLCDTQSIQHTLAQSHSKLLLFLFIVISVHSSVSHIVGRSFSVWRWLASYFVLFKRQRLAQSRIPCHLTQFKSRRGFASQFTRYTNVGTVATTKKTPIESCARLMAFGTNRYWMHGSAQSSISRRRWLLLTPDRGAWYSFVEFENYYVINTLNSAASTRTINLKFSISAKYARGTQQLADMSPHLTRYKRITILFNEIYPFRPKPCIRLDWHAFKAHTFKPSISSKTRNQFYLKRERHVTESKLSQCVRTKIHWNRFWLLFPLMGRPFIDYPEARSFPRRRKRYAHKLWLSVGKTHAQNRPQSSHIYL